MSRLGATVRGRGGTGERAAVGPAGEETRLEQLERLARLKQAGVLDDAEFEREKQQLLVGGPRA
jgi:hypothetical protein